MCIRDRDGNPRPRIFRLPQCESLISRTGFNNPGLDVIKRRLEQKSGSYVLGVNKMCIRDSSQHDASFAHRTIHLFDGSIVASVKA